MHIEQLNDDIISLALRIIAFASTENLDEWRANIPLLHVNRRWRALACPFIHKTAFIEGIEGDKDVQQKLRTNLWFVCKDSSHRYIRSLTIKLDSTMNSFLFYERVCTILSYYSDKLSTTTSLVLCTYSSTADGKEVRLQDIAKISLITKRVIQIIPNVTKLRFHASEACALSDHIYAMLTSAYSHQLLQLTTYRRYLPTRPCQLDSLTCLDISLTDNELITDMLHVSAESLEQLTLYDAPNYFNWDIFEQVGKESTSQTITLTRLRRLRILFSPGWYEQMSALVKSSRILHFPRLEELVLNHLPDDFNLLVSCVFPSQIHKLLIGATIDSLETSVRRKALFPNAQSILLTVVSDYSNETANVTMEEKNRIINGFIERYHGSKETSLYLHSDTEFHCSHQIAKATKLSTIYLYEWNNIDAVIRVIETMPDLAFLYLYLLPEVEMFELDTNDIVEKLEPLNTGISRLTLKASWFGETTQLAFLIVLRYMILRIPSLTRVSADKFILDGIDSFVENHVEMYPHLASIHFISMVD